MCRTQTGAAPGRFFRWETQLAPAVVLRALQNRCPVFAAVPALVLRTTDRPSVAALQLSAADPDRDPVSFRLAAPARLGVASVSAAGLLQYTPREDAVGRDTILVEAVDSPPAPLRPNASRLAIPVQLSAARNRPQLVPFLDGRPAAVVEGEEVDSADVQLRAGVCALPSLLHVVAADADKDDVVRLQAGDGLVAVDSGPADTSRLPDHLRQ